MGAAVAVLIVGMSAAAAQTVGADSQGPSLVSVAIHSRVLKQIAQDEDQRRDDVSSTILGAAVSGCQTTLTSTRLRLQPSEGRARFEVVSSGVVSTDTISNSPQATILGRGHHDFEVIKRVEFDGERILTWPPHGRITARETPYEVHSPLDRLPLIGVLSNQIARGEVMRRYPEIQNAVAADVARDVLSQVNSSVDASLAELCQNLDQLQNQVAGIAPVARLQWTARSTENALQLFGESEHGPVDQESLALRGATQLGDDEDIVVVVSEGFATELAGFLLPSGLTVPDTQLMATVNQSVPQVLDINAIRTLRPPTDSTASLFSVSPNPAAPIRFRFDQGVIETTLNGRVVPKFGSPSDWLTTEVRFRGGYGSDDHWTVRMLPSSPPGNGTTTTGTIWGTAVATFTSSLVDQLDGVGVSRWIPVTLPNHPGQQAQLVQIDCQGGLLRAAFRMRQRAVTE